MPNVSTEARKKSNLRTKARNAARRDFRLHNPQHCGKQLKKWPLEANLG